MTVAINECGLSYEVFIELLPKQTIKVMLFLLRFTVEQESMIEERIGTSPCDFYVVSVPT